jgi:simple sugar transport system ATP-binding protein
VLELEALFALAGRQEEAGLQGLSLTVREGEIFGIGGVVGNGQRVLARIVAGLRPVDRGCVRFGGRDITRDSILKRIHAGIRYLPANPVEEALLPTRSLAENLLLGRHRSGRLQCGGWLRRRSVRAWADELCRRFDVVHGGLGQPLRSLSGGNQQRVALARVLAGKPRLVVMEQPGRGLDVAAQAALQQRIRALQVEGVSFLIFSFDVDELLSLCDRVGVLYRGTLAGIAGSAEVTPAVLGCWMVGLGDAHRQGGNGIGL